MHKYPYIFKCGNNNSTVDKGDFQNGIEDFKDVD